MAKEQAYRDTTTMDTIKALMQGGYKTIFIRDAAGRIEIAYEAPIDAELNEPCLRTQLKYSDGALGSSRQIIAEEEDIVGWPTYEVLQAGYGNDITNVA